MKLLITESQLTYLNENYNRDQFFDIYSELMSEVLLKIRNRQQVTFNLINPVQYKRALDEFIRYGQFMRFPARIIYKWKDICLYNIALLHTFNALFGSESYYPYEEIYDIFDVPEELQTNDFGEIYDLLDEKYDFESFLPHFSNGQCMFSDYGAKPLMTLALKLVEQDSPEEIIVTINKILDVAHQRSDLAELFVVGGSESQYEISNG